MADELVVTKDASDTWLTNWATEANAQVYKIGLFKNNWTPLITSVLADVTPADFGGYAGLLTLTAWDTGGITFTSPRYVCLHPVKTWTANGVSTNSIYGYYVQTAGGVLLWAQRRSTGAVTIGTVNGQTYSVVPQMTGRSEF